MGAVALLPGTIPERRGMLSMGFFLFLHRRAVSRVVSVRSVSGIRLEYPMRFVRETKTLSSMRSQLSGSLRGVHTTILVAVWHVASASFVL